MIAAAPRASRQSIEERYERHKADAAARSRHKSAEGREIGPDLPEVVDPQLRIECEVAGAAAAVTIACSDDAVAAALDRGADRLLSECVRCGCALARIRCAGPATVLLPAA